MDTFILKCRKCGLTLIGSTKEPRTGQLKPQPWLCAECAKKKPGTEAAKMLSKQKQ
ncbi:MAG: hypothetical protein JSS27_01905 [Planctomycetes bacterium]|nr:hypothetical protein [Planctomycetota bacterium]